MEIKATQKFIEKASPVFILKDSERIEQKKLFNFLKEKEKKLLLSFQNSLPKESETTSSIFLGNKKAIFLGYIKNFNHRKAILNARKAIFLAKKERCQELIFSLEDFQTFNIDENDLAQIISAHLQIANFEFLDYKIPPPEGWSLIKRVFIFSSKNIQKGIFSGKIIGQEVNKARALANTPGGELTPKKLAQIASNLGKSLGFKVKILNEKQMKKLKMGGILGVARGSQQRPYFIIIEYLKNKKEKPIVLVGKGVTFDTGGLSLKPSDALQEMHLDMSGAATVLHTIGALSRLKVKKNVVGLIPAVENMPSGASYRPGDLLKTMSGKTIEVLNTDAEGRIILADALEYAKKYQPKLVIDVATLTGAAVVALGQRASAIFSCDEKILQELRKDGELVGDFVWPLPLWEEYEEEIKGTFGDVANIGKTKYGGAIIGAVFLWQFIKEFPWVHIDIAPRMITIENEFLAKGSAGAGVLLLTRFLSKKV